MRGEHCISKKTTETRHIGLVDNMRPCLKNDNLKLHTIYAVSTLGHPCYMRSYGI